MAGSGRLAGVDVSDDDNVDMDLLFSHCCCLAFFQLRKIGDLDCWLSAKTQRQTIRRFCKNNNKLETRNVQTRGKKMEGSTGHDSLSHQRLNCIAPGLDPL